MRLWSSVKAFYDWTGSLIEGRRNAAPRNDVLDSLLTGTVDGRELSDSERMSSSTLARLLSLLAMRPSPRARAGSSSRRVKRT